MCSYNYYNYSNRLLAHKMYTIYMYIIRILYIILSFNLQREITHTNALCLAGILNLPLLQLLCRIAAIHRHGMKLGVFEPTRVQEYCNCKRSTNKYTYFIHTYGHLCMKSYKHLHCSTLP